MNKKDIKNILIITQKIDRDDAILGFFHEWVDRFSKQFDLVTVVCLEKGSFTFPSNVKVLSLGKEDGFSRLKYLKNFYRHVWHERRGYDSVFVHMNPIYVILGGLLWRIMGKRIGMWYTHKNVDLKLRLATLFVDVIFTASKESFRLHNKKVRVMGHGINTTYFIPANRFKKEPYTIVTVGRVSRTKNIHLMIEVIKKLKETNFSARFIIVGPAVTPEDKKYEIELKNDVAKFDLDSIVDFVGSIPPSMVIDWYHSSDLFINLSSTGSLDKAMLEAMACGLQVLTSNEAYKKILAGRYLTENSTAEICSKVIKLSTAPVDSDLRQYVVAFHGLSGLIPRLAENLKSNE